MIEIKSGDYGYNLGFRVTESDGITAKVLTTYTVHLKVWDNGNSILDGACDIDIALSGTCHYEVQDGNFVIASDLLYKDYHAELELISTTEKTSTETITLRVYSSPS